MSGRSSKWISSLLTTWILVLVGCGDDDTVIDLFITYDDTWGLTELQVQATGQTRTAAAGHRVALIIPDELAGAPVSIEVVGLRGTEPFAKGTKLVTAKRNATVSDAMGLALLSCATSCVEGTTTCRTGGVSSCEQLPSSCFDWGAPAACAAFTRCLDGACAPAYETFLEVGTTSADLDLLFVIDDSPSMTDKQVNVADAMTGFFAALSTATPNGLPNLHVGVITTDVGTKGTEGASAASPIGQVGMGGCSGTGKGGNLVTSPSVTGPFVSDVFSGGGRVKNYTGDLAAVVGAMIRGVGSGGCGFEQPLHAVRRALDANPANTGFSRPEAGLGIVLVTDEDDCTVGDAAMFTTSTTTLGPLQSFRCTRYGVRCEVGGQTTDAMNMVGAKDECAATGASFLDDVAPYQQFLLSHKVSATKLAVASIMAPSEPFAVELRALAGGTPEPALARSCMYQGTPRPSNPTGIELGDPPTRLADFLALFPGRTYTSTICTQDQRDAMTSVAQLMSVLTAVDPCVVREIPDADLSTPGVQPDCIVEDVDGAAVTVVPTCSGAPQPVCWQLESDAIACPTGSQRQLVVTRAVPAAPGTVTRLRCLVP